MDNLSKTERDILKRIQKGDFVISLHAQTRMLERNIVSDDIVSVASSARSIRWQKKHESYLIKGNDLLGKKLSIAADLEDDVIIVTVFYEDT